MTTSMNGLGRFSSGLRKIFRRSERAVRRGGQASARRLDFRPRLEQLECREVPSAVVSTTAPLRAVYGASAAGGGMLGAAPTTPSLSAVAVSGSQINLYWSGMSGANGYLVDLWANGAWQQIGNVSSGTTSYAVGGLSAGTTYYFDVGAYNLSGISWANYQSATTPRNFGPPAAPTFSATAASASQINLAWSVVFGANGYLVDVWANGTWQQIANLGSGSTSCAVTGLNAGTTYYFALAAYNGSGTSWSANAQSATTTAGTTRTFDHPTAAATYSNVSGSLFGSTGPFYQDVRQGAVGDCWLMSALAEVAARSPSVIQSMFTYTGTAVEGGVTVSVYSVRLYDNSGVAHSVVVDTMLPAGGAYYDHVANGVLWVALAEKAYAEANGEGFVTTQHLGSDSYSALDGGQPSWALRAITGKSASDLAINPSNIAAAWNAGKYIVLGSSSSPSSQYIVGGSDGTHAYAVVGYTSSSSQPFTVYNPWGTDSSGWALGNYHNHQVYGLFTANAAFISANFAAQSICGATHEGTAFTATALAESGPSPENSSINSSVTYAYMSLPTSPSREAEPEPRPERSLAGLLRRGATSNGFVLESLATLVPLFATSV